MPAADVAAYREALVERFANPRIRHLLAQIAADGSQKLPVRILPTVRLERAAGRLPQRCAAGARGLDQPPARRRRAGEGRRRRPQLLPLAAGELTAAVRAVIGYLDAELATDDEVVDAVVALSEQLTAG